ncbi:MAG: glucosaminidase domain-containing protein [Candidatus Dormibacteraeota bacterium]|nr:glucosaminidase domain-containing protein [Candidatus Dormibacteraeota bacterium]
MRAQSWLVRHRIAVAVPFVAVLTFMAQPASAAGDPQDAVNQANSQLHAAQVAAGAEDSALGAARTALAQADAQLAALNARITTLDATINIDTTSLRRIDSRLAADREHLSSYLRDSYENGGSEAALIYLFSSSSIAQVIERKVQLDQVATAVRHLVSSIQDDARRAASTLADADRAKAQLQAAQQQAVTEQAVVAVQTEQLTAADMAAHLQVNAAQKQLSSAQAALAAALAAAQAQGTVYPPVNGSQFTVDTDLTLPSGESAQRIDSFLQGTDLAGLGASFMRAESTYHVSARYFVAHAILESDWGASAIAQNKHNLFGFGADDANPYGDAMTFPSFDACIQYVAHFIAVNYLTPGGAYYHGPTLRGMNVDYASDPNWAFKIAAIARTIP